MPFNDRGEIIRNFGGRTTAYNSALPDDQPQPKEGCMIPFLIIIFFAVIIVLFSLNNADTTGGRLEVVVTEQNDVKLRNPNQYGLSDANDTDTLSGPLVNIVHPFGLGSGKLAIFKHSSGIGNVEISIDGKRIGKLCKSYSLSGESPYCDDSATVSTILSVGQHNLYAKDNHGNKWEFPVSVMEDECKMQELNLRPLEFDLFQSKVAGMLDGNWYGNVYRHDLARNINVLFNCKLSKRQFNIIYPSLGYVGTWEVEGVDNESVTFKEYISFGHDGVSSYNQIRLEIVDNRKLRILYYMNRGVEAMGKLVKLEP